MPLCLACFITFQQKVLQKHVVYTISCIS